MSRKGLKKILKKLQTRRQSEPGETVTEMSGGCVGPERLKKVTQLRERFMMMVMMMMTVRVKMVFI